LDTREITLAAIIAALYATLVIVLAPISFGPIQLRVADCLMPLAALLGLPAVIGGALGAFIGNAYFMQFTGPIDVVFGALANLAAGYLIFRLREAFLTACLVGSVTVGVIVGGYLWIYFPPPSLGIGMPVWMAMIVSITLSSILAIAVIGYLLVRALRSAGVDRILSSQGLKTYME
jgi:uncharacterized membrane protein